MEFPIGDFSPGKSLHIHTQRAHLSLTTRKQNFIYRYKLLSGISGMSRNLVDMDALCRVTEARSPEGRRVGSQPVNRYDPVIPNTRGRHISCRNRCSYILLILARRLKQRVRYSIENFNLERNLILKENLFAGLNVFRFVKVAGKPVACIFNVSDLCDSLRGRLSSRMR